MCNAKADIINIYSIEKHILRLNSKITELEQELVDLEIKILDFSEKRTLSYNIPAPILSLEDETFQVPDGSFVEVMHRQVILDRITLCQNFLTFWETRHHTM